MLIATPDAQFQGGPDLEQAAAAALGRTDVEFRLFRGLSLGVIDEATLAACDGMIVWHEVTMGAAEIARVPRCRVIVRGGVGVDNIDLEAAARRGMPVCNVPDYGTTDVADTAMALLLALGRGIVSFNAALGADLKAGWRPDVAPAAGRLRGRRFGAVGCGRIGTATLRRARAFDLEVGFFDPFQPDGYELGLGARRFDSLDELLAWADVVSLHAPLTASNRNLIGADAFARMKPGAILINTARGGLVDIDALEQALRSGRLAAAGIDVLPAEPPPPHPLFEAWQRQEPWIAGRLILTPHVAWFSAESRIDIRTKSARTAVRYLATGVLRNCMNADLLHRYGTWPAEAAQS